MSAAVTSMKPGCTPTASRPARFSLWGPIPYYDLIRTARRGRYIWVRFAYVSAILVLFLAVNDLSGARLSGSAQLAEFGSSLFVTFMLTQLVAVVILTPAYVATALTEEKEGKTLEFLLASDLGSGEIVVGKLIARLANLGLLIFAGLPILSLLQFIGGIDPKLVLAGFAVTALTMLALGSLSVLCSVYAPRSVRALVLVYLLVALYLVLSALLIQVGLAAAPLRPGPRLGDLADWLCAGNLPMLLAELHSDWKLGTPDARLLRLLGAYGLFQTLLTVICLRWATARLRTVAQQQAAGPKRRHARRRVRPPIGERPMLWKEIHVAPGPRLGRGFRLVLGLMFCIGAAFWLGPLLASLLVGSLIGLGDFLEAMGMASAAMMEQEGHGWTWLPGGVHRPEFNAWLTLPGVGMACVLFLGLAMRAAGCVCGERSRQTLGGLLMTPLPTRTILGDKVRACLLSSRAAWWWLAALVVFGYMTDGLVRELTPLLLVAAAVYAVFFTMLGLWCSTVCRTTGVAVVIAITLALTLLLGPWCLSMAGGGSFRMGPPFTVLRSSADSLFLTSPALLLLALSSWGMGPSQPGQVETASSQAVFICLPFLVPYAIEAGLLWGWACLRFRARYRPLDPISGGKPERTLGAWRRLIALVQGARCRPSTLALFVPAPFLRRWFWACTLVVFAVALAGHLWLSSFLDRRLRAVEQNADRLDPGWRFEEMQARRMVVSEAENAALVVQSLGPQLTKGWYGYKNKTAAWRPRETRDPFLFSPLLIDAIRRDPLATVRKDVATVRREAPRLATLPPGRYPIEHTRSGSPPVSLLDIQPISSILAIDAILQLAENDPHAALQDFRAILQVGRGLADEPAPAYRLVRLDCWEDAVVVLERLLGSGLLSDDELHAVQQVLESEAAELTLLPLVRGERAFFDFRCAAVESGDLSVFTGSTSPPVSRILDQLARSPTKVFHTAILDFMTTYIAEIEQRPAIQAAQARQLLDQYRTTVASELGYRRLRNVIKRLQYGQARLYCAITALAAERYRRRHGKWPDSLDQLVPDFQSQVAMDPFSTMAPLRSQLELAGLGLVIYSVGADGQNNGGNLDRRPDVAGTDWGIRLRIPDRRSPSKLAAPSPPGRMVSPIGPN